MNDIQMLRWYVGSIILLLRLLIGNISIFNRRSSDDITLVYDPHPYHESPIKLHCHD